MTPEHEDPVFRPQVTIGSMCRLVALLAVFFACLSPLKQADRKTREGLLLCEPILAPLVLAAAVQVCVRRGVWRQWLTSFLIAIPFAYVVVMVDLGCLLTVVAPSPGPKAPNLFALIIVFSINYGFGWQALHFGKRLIPDHCPQCARRRLFVHMRSRGDRRSGIIELGRCVACGEHFERRPGKAWRAIGPRGARQEDDDASEAPRPELPSPALDILEEPIEVVRFKPEEQALAVHPDMGLLGTNTTAPRLRITLNGMCRFVGLVAVFFACLLPVKQATPKTIENVLFFEGTITPLALGLATQILVRRGVLRLWLCGLMLAIVYATLLGTLVRMTAYPLRHMAFSRVFSTPGALYLFFVLVLASILCYFLVTSCRQLIPARCPHCGRKRLFLDMRKKDDVFVRGVAFGRCVSCGARCERWLGRSWRVIEPRGVSEEEVTTRGTQRLQATSPPSPSPPCGEGDRGGEV